MIFLAQPQGAGLLGRANTSFQSHPPRTPGPDFPSAPAAPLAWGAGSGTRGTAAVWTERGHACGSFWRRRHVPGNQSSCGPPGKIRARTPGQEKAENRMGCFALWLCHLSRCSPPEKSWLLGSGRQKQPHCIDSEGQTLPQGHALSAHNQRRKTHFCFAVYAPSSRNALEVILEAAAMGCFEDRAEEDMPHVYGF